MLILDRIAHIPLPKRRQLVRALEILFEEFEEAQKGKLSEKAKRGRILKVILYGSFARGTWKDDRRSGYVSDFDLLVVVNDERFGLGYEAWDNFEDRFMQPAALREHPRPHPSLTLHTYQEVNDQLAMGIPFFVDIRRDGIVLYEAQGHPFSEPGPLTPEQQTFMARLHFTKWFPNGEGFVQASEFMVARGHRRLAAFLLHQAGENFYHCILLVLTLYSPKLHDLKKLRHKAEGHDVRLVEAWPRNTRFSRRCFSRIRDAYVNARYSPHYEITAEEYAWSFERMKVLGRIVAEICAERLGGLPDRTEDAASSPFPSG